MRSNFKLSNYLNKLFLASILSLYVARQDSTCINIAILKIRDFNFVISRAVYVEINSKPDVLPL